MITHEEIRRQVEEKDVRYLRLIFTDILGTIKNVEVPIRQLDKVLANKMMFDGSSIEGFVRIEESDMYLYPDLSTWVVFPWSSSSLVGDTGKKSPYFTNDEKKYIMNDYKKWIYRCQFRTKGSCRIWILELRRLLRLVLVRVWGRSSGPSVR